MAGVWTLVLVPGAKCFEHNFGAFPRKLPMSTKIVGQYSCLSRLILRTLSKLDKVVFAFRMPFAILVEYKKTVKIYGFREYDK